MTQKKGDEFCCYEGIDLSSGELTGVVTDLKVAVDSLGKNFHPELLNFSSWANSVWAGFFI